MAVVPRRQMFQHVFTLLYLAIYFIATLKSIFLHSFAWHIMIFFSLLFTPFVIIFFPQILTKTQYVLIDDNVTLATGTNINAGTKFATILYPQVRQQPCGKLYQCLQRCEACEWLWPMELPAVMALLAICAVQQGGYQTGKLGTCVLARGHLTHNHLAQRPPPQHLPQF